MRSIWKFQLVDSTAPLQMPKGATVLAVQDQQGMPTLWAEVDTKAKLEQRVFRIFGTGFDMPRGMGYSDRYIGTFQQGAFVWHVYELTGV